MPDGTSTDTQEIVVIPGAFYNRKSKPQAFVYKEDGDEECDPVLLKALVQAEIWSNEMERGTYCAYKEIADAYGLDEQYVRRTFYLSYLSPKIKEAFVRQTVTYFELAGLQKTPSVARLGGAGGGVFECVK
jgi:hypothetical protein